MRLKPVVGNFTAFSEGTLLVGKDQVSIARATVFSVKNQGIAHRRRNTLLGLGIGAVAGLAIGAIKGAAYHELGEIPVFLLVMDAGRKIASVVNSFLDSRSATPCACRCTTRGSPVNPPFNSRRA